MDSLPRRSRPSTQPHVRDLATNAPQGKLRSFSVLVSMWGECSALTARSTKPVNIKNGEIWLATHPMRSPLTPGLPIAISPSFATNPSSSFTKTARDLLRPTYADQRQSHSWDSRAFVILNRFLKSRERQFELAETWGDKAKEAIAIRLHKSVKELIAHLTDTAFAERSPSVEQGGRTKSLPVHPRHGRLEGIDQLVYRAIRSLGLNPNGEALRLCLAYALGELESLTLAINDTFGKGGRTQFHQSLDRCPSDHSA